MEREHKCPFCRAGITTQNCAVFFRLQGDPVTFNDQEGGDRLLFAARNLADKNIEEAVVRYRSLRRLTSGWFFRDKLDFSGDEEFPGWYKLSVDRDQPNAISATLYHKTLPRTLTTNIPACSVCGYPLPTDFFECEQIFISLVGKPMSGKSVALSVSMRSNCDCFNRAITGSVNRYSAVMADDWAYRGWYSSSAIKLNRDILPGHTERHLLPPAQIRRLCADTKYLISIFDASGDILDFDHPAEFAYLSDCDGCIIIEPAHEMFGSRPNSAVSRDRKVLLSEEEQKKLQAPSAAQAPLSEKYANVDLDNIVGYVEGYLPSNGYIAFALSKADIGPEKIRALLAQSAAEKGKFQANIVNQKSTLIQQYLREAGHPIRLASEESKYFAFSALGYIEIDNKEERLLKQIDPMCLEEPFLWIIEKVISDRKKQQNTTEA